MWEDKLFFPGIKENLYMFNVSDANNRKKENFMGMKPQKFPGIPIEKYPGSILDKHEALV